MTGRWLQGKNMQYLVQIVEVNCNAGPTLCCLEAVLLSCILGIVE
jgi:hypothetical protein